MNFLMFIDNKEPAFLKSDFKQVKKFKHFEDNGNIFKKFYFLKIRFFIFV